VESPEQAFVTKVDQTLSSPQAGELLEELSRTGQGPFERSFAAGFSYRVQAVATGVLPSRKAELYERAAEAFGRARDGAVPALVGLIDSRRNEHEAFALITRAGMEAETNARAALYEQSCALLDQAVATLPSHYRRTRLHLLGWGALCRAKANALRADDCGDADSKTLAHQECSRLFEGSAKYFREAGQESLAHVSEGWRSFSDGWSAYFGGNVALAEERFRSTLAAFHGEGRHDLLAACVECLQQTGWEVASLLPA
jgi:hypothetical protein